MVSVRTRRSGKIFMQTGKADVEQLIREGRTVQIFPEGYSMYPMLVPGRDEVVIGRADIRKLRRGAVILFRRESGLLVLHRLVRTDGSGFYAVGDNQTEVEGPLSADQIKGILIAFVRKGRYIPVSNPLYRVSASLWLFLLPVRGIILKIGTRLRHIR